MGLFFSPRTLNTSSILKLRMRKKRPFSPLHSGFASKSRDYGIFIRNHSLPLGEAKAKIEEYKDQRSAGHIGASCWGETSYKNSRFCHLHIPESLLWPDWLAWPVDIVFGTPLYNSVILLIYGICKWAPLPQFIIKKCWQALIWNVLCTISLKEMIEGGWPTSQREVITNKNIALD